MQAQKHPQISYGRISVLLVRDAPDLVPVLIAAGQFQGQQMRLPGQGPELSGALETILQLRAGRLHGARTPGTATRRSLLVMQMLTMILKVIMFALKRPGLFFTVLPASLNQIRQSLEHAGLPAMVELMQQRLGPLPRRGGAFA